VAEDGVVLEERILVTALFLAQEVAVAGLSHSKVVASASSFQARGVPLLVLQEG